MEEGSFHLVGQLRVVQAIAEDRVTGGRQVDPHLVGSASIEATTDHRQVLFELSNYLDLGSGCFAAVVTLKSPSVVEIAGDWKVDIESARGGVTLDNCKIETFDPTLPPGSAELWQNVRGARKKHGAAGHAIESMDHAQKRLTAFSPGKGEQHLLVEGEWVTRAASLGRL